MGLRLRFSHLGLKGSFLQGSEGRFVAGLAIGINEGALFNDQFVVWIVPQIFDHEPVTFALVGILAEEGIHLELVFATSGVYNTSKIVLKVLERLLEDIQENEEILGNLS